MTAGRNSGELWGSASFRRLPNADSEQHQIGGAAGDRTDVIRAGGAERVGVFRILA
jgi:hypothetical protein